MKKLVLYCFLLLFGQMNAFGSTAFSFDDVNPLSLLDPSLTDERQLEGSPALSMTTFQLGGKMATWIRKRCLPTLPG